MLKTRMNEKKTDSKREYGKNKYEKTLNPKRKYEKTNT